MNFLTTGAQLVGLAAVLVRPKRSIGPFSAMVTLEEKHEDTLVITDHPVEKGALISDHAFKEPARVSIRCAWSDSPSNPSLAGVLTSTIQGTLDGISSLLGGNSATQVRDIYDKLLKLQASAVPMDIYTGKRKYSNMLIHQLVVETDKNSENMLAVTANCREVIIVQTAIVLVSTDKDTQKAPELTMSSSNAGVKNLQPSTGLSENTPGRN